MTRTALLAALLAGPLVAHADPCARDDGSTTGPLAPGLLDGDLGRAGSACLHEAFGLFAATRFTLPAGAPSHHVVRGLHLDFSRAVYDDLLVVASVEAIRHEVLTSVLSASYFGIGHASLGAAWRFGHTERRTLSLRGRLVLPTAVGLYEQSWPLGADSGLAGVHAVVPGLRFHWQASLVTSVAVSGGPPDPRLGLVPTLGAEVRLLPWLGFVADLTGSTGYTERQDHVAGAAGLRVRRGHGFAAEVSAGRTLAWRDPPWTTARLRLTWKLEPARSN